MDDFNKIVARIKKKEGLSTNQQLAELFGLSPQEFSRRKKRETLLPLLIEWGINHSEDLNWLLTGKESSSINNATSSHTIEQKHMNLVKGFMDKKRALEIDRELIELEKLDPETFRRVESYIKGTVDTVREVITKKPYQGIERRIAQRREQNDPSQAPEGIDRRSGEDRRKAG